MDHAAPLAFDRSVRHFDVDGRMHVDLSNISKAMVCPYFGREIPDADKLGLDAEKLYMLYRDPVELAKAAPTFNRQPLMIVHKPVSAIDSNQDLVVGTTGSDVEFVAPYLRCSLSVWDAAAIAGIETKEQAELSAGYHYRADMTPGEVDGVAYDGVMRDIIGNHVALVDIGRAGADVVVGDSDPFSIKGHDMSKKVSSMAIMLAGALAATVRPLLAADKSVSMREVVADVTVKNFKEKQAAIKARLIKATEGKLAKDATLTPAQIDGILDAMVGVEDNDLAVDDAAMLPVPAMDVDDDEMEDDPENPGQKRKKKKEVAMDSAAVNAAIKIATDNAVEIATATAAKNAEALFTARREVEPLCGIVGMDSAEAVYAFALDQAKIPREGVHPSAFRSLVQMHLKSKESGRVPAVIAVDHAMTGHVAALAPGLSRFNHA